MKRNSCGLGRLLAAWGFAMAMLGGMGGCAPSPSTAGSEAGETLYVQPSALNARSDPSTDAPVVQKLPEGAALRVVERSGDWTKVEQGSDSFWVASRHIGTTQPVSRRISGSASQSASSLAVHPMALASAMPSKAGIKKSAKKKKKRRASSGIYSGGSCPCNGGTVCIGPRGGRYCITSGGNKRYGV